jgi:hypothetical protein
MSSIQILFDQNKVAFAKEVTPFLEKNEAVNAMMLGMCFALSEGAFADKEFGLIRILNNKELTSVAIKAPNSSLVLTFISDEELNALINTLVEKSIEVPKILGPLEVCKKFSQIWSEKMNLTSKLSMKQKIYQLDKVNDLERVDGAMAQADDRDKKILVEWYMAMVKEAIPDDKMSLEEAQEWVDRKIAANELFLWIQNEWQVSMAALVGATRNGIRISAVYTPPDLRRRGIATSLVANLSQYMLDQGTQKCFLYADQMNPTSNSIYQKIGYNPVCESALYLFE